MRMRIRGTSPLTRCSSSTSSSYHHNAPILRLSQLLILLLVVCALLLDTVAAADLDYWKILGLRRGASDTDIKKAYRKLSKKFHPDKNKSEDAEQRFVEVSQAYEVLSDEEKRDVYNKYGHDGLRQHAQGGSAQHHNPFDIFSSFFGGHSGHSQQTRKGPNMVMEMEIDLQDVYTGKTYDITIQRKQICDHCTGTGAKSRDDIVQCDVCQGRGIRIVKHMLAPGMYQQVQMQCDHCNARGKIIKHACPVCKGARIIEAESEISVDIDRGLPEGAELVFEGEADENPDWDAGDLVVRVRTRPYKGGFMRRGSNLYWTESISVADALLGFERNLQHFDNHSIRLKSPSSGHTIQPGHVDVLHGEGLPRYHSSDFGDLFVEYNVILPDKVSPETAKKLKAAFGRTEDGSEDGTKVHQEL